MKYSQRELLEEGIWDTMKVIGKGVAKTLAPQAYNIASNTYKFGQELNDASKTIEQRIEKYVNDNGYRLITPAQGQSAITQNGKVWVAIVKEIKYDSTGSDVTDQKGKLKTLIFDKDGKYITRKNANKGNQQQGSQQQQQGNQQQGNQQQGSQQQQQGNQQQGNQQQGSQQQQSPPP